MVHHEDSNQYSICIKKCKHFTHLPSDVEGQNVETILMTTAYECDRNWMDSREYGKRQSLQSSVNPNIPTHSELQKSVLIQDFKT